MGFINKIVVIACEIKKNKIQTWESGGILRQPMKSYEYLEYM